MVSIILAAGCPFLPHSPRWLHHVGRHAEARAAWERLGVNAADVEKTEQAARREEVPREGLWKEMRQMWKKGIRTRTALGVFLSGMQQASGVDGVLYVRFLPTSWLAPLILPLPVCSGLVLTSRQIGRAHV